MEVSMTKLKELQEEPVGLVDEFVVNPDLDQLDTINAIDYRVERIQSLATILQSAEDGGYDEIPSRIVAGIGYLLAQQVSEIEVLQTRYQNFEIKAKNLQGEANG